MLGQQHVDDVQDTLSLLPLLCEVGGAAEGSEEAAHHDGHAIATVDELQECMLARLYCVRRS